MAGVGCGRGLCGCHPPRKRLLVCMLLLLAGSLFTIGVITSGYLSVIPLKSSPQPIQVFPKQGRSRLYLTQLPREYPVESQIAEMQTHLKFLESLYRARQEDIINMQIDRSDESYVVWGPLVYPVAGPPYKPGSPASFNHKIGSTTVNSSQQSTLTDFQSTVTPDVSALLNNNSDSMVAQGLRCKELTLMKTMFVLQLLPHLMNDPASLRPSFHMRAHSDFVKTVIGVPSVKRDKEKYLMTTLKFLIAGMTDEDFSNTLIIIFMGETDLQYVIKTAQEIEARYPKHVKNGHIELLAPNRAYYPDFKSVPLTLGDSTKRVEWRTKQNLDTLYLMAYGQTRGTYYLMLEDDVVAKDKFMKEINEFTTTVTVSTPKWFFIEFCGVGGIGKLFKSSDLVHFITYVQLFYYNMPIDWLLESYLADRVCTIDKTSAACGKNKLDIRPKYKDPLFQHIGMFSSLKGKIQKVKDTKFSSDAPFFYPHTNPKTREIKCSMTTHADHYIDEAYRGTNFFWGVNPKPGDVIEYWFAEPTNLASYQFRSGNILHPTDKLKDTVVEIYPHDKKEFITIGSFDEFGLAEGSINRAFGPLDAIRLRLNSIIHHWIIISEIDLKTYEEKREE